MKIRSCSKFTWVDIHQPTSVTVTDANPNAVYLFIWILQGQTFHKCLKVNQQCIQEMTDYFCICIYIVSWKRESGQSGCLVVTAVKMSESRSLGTLQTVHSTACNVFCEILWQVALAVIRLTCLPSFKVRVSHHIYYSWCNKKVHKLVWHVLHLVIILINPNESKWRGYILVICSGNGSMCKKSQSVKSVSRGCHGHLIQCNSVRNWGHMMYFRQINVSNKHCHYVNSYDIVYQCIIWSFNDCNVISLM